MDGGASRYSRVSRCSTVGAGALKDHSSSRSSSSDMSSNNLVGSLGVVSCWIQMLCFFNCVLQWRNIASLKRACVDVKITLFKDCMNMWLHSFPISTSRYVISLEWVCSSRHPGVCGHICHNWKLGDARYLESQIATTYMECANSITSLESGYICGQHAR